ncbi:LOW QUALITY PROTEIN: hypothetical protein PHMEG_00014683 [Phytophthora megakarya]|uniref:Reverse transcriptase n=1 Tax=Phytophthora megakarya TaxID=4795 RepID=A0A225W3Q4_9STRA|nr:LOW QUALITY PROTEIN: hypothetical protein PHMEG_00014683 [Phytophthora megakarya]
MKTRSGLATQVTPANQISTTNGTSTKRNETGPVTTITASVSKPAVPATSSSIMPPCVTDVSYSALVKWKRERQEYEDAIDARCSATDEDKLKVLRSIKNSFNRSLLKPLCKFEWGMTIEEVTEERIRSELYKIIGSVMNDDIIDVELLFDQELKMDLREADVKARVINYFMLCDDIILGNGLSNTFSTPNGIKAKCKFLKQYLEPVALRDAVDTHHCLVDSSSKTDERVLYQLVKDKALEQEKVFRLLSKRKQHPGEGSSKPRREARKGQRPGTNQNNNIRVVRNDAGEHRNIAATSKTGQKPGTNSKSKPRTGCFHCGKDHWLSQCPDLDGAAKETLLAERKAKKVPKANVISRKHVQLLQEQDTTVKPVKLDDAVESRAVGGALLTSTHAVDIRLTLNTAAGPVRCQDPKRCLIVESDEDEVLVGKALLSELGIDIEQQLKYLASQGTDDDDSFEKPDGIPPCKSSVGDVVMKVVDALVQDAIDRGIVDDYITSRLFKVVRKYGGWRRELGGDPPAKVPPLKIRVKANTNPYRCKVRQYSPSKSAFLEKFNKRLVDLGWVYENRERRWCCPALPVRKPNTDEFRQITEYRPLNAATEPIAGVMPSLEVALEHCKSKMFYAMFDFLKGVWQLPLSKCSQAFLSYMTDKGVFTPTRGALMLPYTFNLLWKWYFVNKCVIVWIDDLLVFADTQKELVDAIEAVLTKLDEHGLILNPKKSTVFLKEVRWCGRIINQHGVDHDPERIQRFVKCHCRLLQLNFSSSYSTILALLDLFKNDLMLHCQGLRKRSERPQIDLNTDERAAFETVKDLLGNSAILTYPDPSKQLIPLSDASDRGWGLVVSQVSDCKTDVPIHEQNHELLVCMGGSFTGSALNWSVIEKESFPIVHACDKLEYLLLRPQGFRLYCDHRKIIYLFCTSKELKRHVRSKLLRWPMKLLEYRYSIEHIEGVHNVWADLISRWGGKPLPAARIHSIKRITRSKRRRGGQQQSSVQSLRPLDQDGFVWPTIDEKGSVQALYHTPQGATLYENELWRLKGRIWIPHEARDLTQLLLVIAHCGRNGNRHGESCRPFVQHWWSQRNGEGFLLLCLHVKGGTVIPRPFSETHHTFERNATLHWDVLTLGDSFGSSRYVLILKDEATHFVDLVACDDPTSTVAVTAILDWYSRFGAPEVWVSDLGSRFKAKVIAELSRRLKGRQEFVLAYSPWKNGSIERVNRDILQVLEALALEFRVTLHDWPYLLPLAMSSINHSPVSSLANRAPIELFTGLPCPNTLDTVFFSDGKGRVATLNNPRPNTEKQLTALQESIVAMHKSVEAERKKQDKRYRARHHYEQDINFSVGDYVLRSRVDEKLHANKLRIMWVGPYRVIASTDYYFTVKHLVNGITMNVHPSHLKFYADDSLDVSEELLDHVASQGTLVAVKPIVEHRFNADMNAYEVKVKWLGLESIEDSWEALKTIGEDVPQLLLAYANDTNDDGLILATTRSTMPKKQNRSFHSER